MVITKNKRFQYKENRRYVKTIFFISMVIFCFKVNKELISEEKNSMNICYIAVLKISFGGWVIDG